MIRLLKLRERFRRLKRFEGVLESLEWLKGFDTESSSVFASNDTWNAFQVSKLKTLEF